MLLKLDKRYETATMLKLLVNSALKYIKHQFAAI